MISIVLPTYNCQLFLDVLQLLGLRERQTLDEIVMVKAYCRKGAS